MDPRAEKNAGLHLPKPSMGRADFSPGQYEGINPGHEIGTAAPEAKAITSPIQQPIAIQPPLPPDPMSQTVNDPSGPLAQQQVNPAGDAAGDELDKEWVHKAKMIVEKTKDDPYKQSHEIGQVKADYLRIRFNKHIKVTQDKA